VLSHSLACHSQTWLSAESDFMAPLIKGTEKAHDFGTRRGKFHWLCAEEVGRDELLASVGAGINSLYTDRSGGLRWVEQTPLYTRYMLQLGAMFPGARFVHLVRDGRDVVQSMTNSGFESVDWSSDFAKACKAWHDYLTEGLAYSEQLGERALTVRHEALIEEPRAVMGKILEHLELPFEEATLEFFEGGERINSSFGDKKGKRRSWQEDWSARQLAQFERACGPLLFQLGYEAGDGAPRGSRLFDWIKK
jgi:hypothetical protein